MRTIYIGSDFKCHTVNDGTMTSVETDFFDGKCTIFVEGYRFIPSGEICTLPDGIVLYGKMFAPWKDYTELDVAQREYERQKLAEYEEALKVVGVTV